MQQVCKCCFSTISNIGETRQSPIHTKLILKSSITSPMTLVLFFLSMTTSKNKKTNKLVFLSPIFLIWFYFWLCVCIVPPSGDLRITCTPHIEHKQETFTTQTKEGRIYRKHESRGKYGKAKSMSWCLIIYWLYHLQSFLCLAFISLFANLLKSSFYLFIEMRTLQSQSKSAQDTWTNTTKPADNFHTLSACSNNIICGIVFHVFGQHFLQKCITFIHFFVFDANSRSFAWK